MYFQSQGCRNVIQQSIDALREPVQELLRNYNADVERTLRLASEEFFGNFPSLGSQVDVRTLITAETRSVDV